MMKNKEMNLLIKLQKILFVSLNKVILKLEN